MERDRRARIAKYCFETDGYRIPSAQVFHSETVPTQGESYEAFEPDGLIWSGRPSSPRYSSQRRLKLDTVVPAGYDGIQLGLADSIRRELEPSVLNGDAHLST